MSLRGQQDRLRNLRLLEEIDESTFAAKSRERRDRITQLTIQIEGCDRSRADQAKLTRVVNFRKRSSGSNSSSASANRNPCSGPSETETIPPWSDWPTAGERVAGRVWTPRSEKSPRRGLAKFASGSCCQPWPAIWALQCAHCAESARRGACWPRSAYARLSICSRIDVEGVVTGSIAQLLHLTDRNPNSCPASALAA